MDKLESSLKGVWKRGRLGRVLKLPKARQARKLPWERLAARLPKKDLKLAKAR